MKPIAKSTRYRVNPDIAHVEQAGAIALHSWRSDEVTILNETAAVAWVGVLSAATVGEIIDRVAAQYDADYDAVQADVLELLLQLEKSGALQRTDEG